MGRAEQQLRRQRAAEQMREQMDAETRQRIELAVMDVFAVQEYHRVKLIDIATRANVSLQTIYKYYGGKEALLFSSLDTWLGELAARMLDHLQGIESPKERLRKVFWVVLDFFEKNPRVMQILMSSVHINTWRRQGPYYDHPELFDALLNLLREGREKGLVNDAVDEKILLDYYIGVLLRLAQMYVQRGMKQPLSPQANVLFDMMWRALEKSA